MARCRQWQRNSEHSDITCCAVLDVKFVKPAPLRADRYFCEIETVGHEPEDDAAKRQEKVGKAYRRNLAQAQKLHLVEARQLDSGRLMLWLPER